MHLLAITLATLILIGLAVQSWQSFHLARLFKNYAPVELKKQLLPRCAVVLCLRGCDPGLKERIEMLIDQEYPDFHVYLIIDHESDPSVEVVNEIASRRKPVHLTVRFIDAHPLDCSLVANNHGTVLPELAADYPVLALVDADAATWPTWLRTLVTPLVNSTEIGLVSGNRWYMPMVPTFASIIRMIWNYGSVQQMVFFKYPWGGSLAMKSEIAAAPQFAQQLKKSFGNDTLMYSLARSAGFQVAFHPGMMLVNKEQIRLSDFFSWMVRQILYARLYHPSWPALLGTGVATSTVIGLSIASNVVSLIAGDWASFCILTSTLMIFQGVWIGFLFHLDRTVAGMVSPRGEPQRWWSVATAIKIFLIAPLVQFVFLAGLYRAAVTRKVNWRGIEYEIDGPFNVRMLEYRPYGEKRAANESIL